MLQKETNKSLITFPIFKRVCLYLLGISLPFLCHANPVLYPAAKARRWMQQIYAAQSKQDISNAAVYCDSLKRLADAFAWQGMTTFVLQQRVKLLQMQANQLMAAGQHDLYQQVMVKIDTFLVEHKMQLGNVFEDLDLEHQYNWSVFYKVIGDYPESNRRFAGIIRALDSKETLSSNQMLFYCYTLQYVAEYYQAFGDNEQAVNLYLRALDYIKNPKQARGRYLASYSSIAQIYQRQNKAAVARDYYYRALDSLKVNLPAGQKMNLNGVILHYRIAAFHLENGHPDSALQILQSEQLPDTLFSANIQEVFGAIYTQQQRYQAAEAAFNRAEQLRGAHRDHFTASLYKAIAQMWAQRGQHQKALIAYQKSLYHLSYRFNSTNMEDNPSLEEVYRKQDLLQVLQLKAESCYAIYTSNPTDTTYLKFAWNCANAALALIHSVRMGYATALDKQFIIENSFPIFERAIFFSYLLYQQTERTFYRDFAFQVFEGSKSLLLYEAVNRAQLLNLARFEPKKREQFQILQAELRDIEDKIQRERTKAYETIAQRDSAIRLLQDAFFSKKQQYDALEIKLTQANTKYEELKYRLRNLSIDKLRASLDGQTSVVEYFEGNQQTFVFILSKDTTAFLLLQDAPPSVLTEQVNTLRHSIEKRDTVFPAAAYSLYEKIWQPFEYLLKPRVVIIPDGVLNYVPFEVLLSKPVPTTDIYHPIAYQYLLKDYQISYAYSLALLNKMNSINPVAGRFVGFAPAFAAHNKDDSKLIAAQRGEFGPLYHNKEEVQSIPWSIAGKRLYGKNANLKNFLKYAPLYRFIHLSTHAKANDAKGQESIIVFSSKKGVDTCDVNSIASLNLQADMVVLSACETGLGEWQRGEGIIGLTRGFIIAGASSVIMTLWSVNDHASADLMKFYYAALKAGKQKDEALKAAKLQLMQDPQLAYPYYWAGFIANGNMSALKFKNNRSYLIWSLSGLMFVSALFIFRKQFHRL